VCIGIGAGVVHEDPVADSAAKQVVDGLAGILTEEIPERYIHRRHCAHLGAGEAEEVHGGEHVRPVPLDIEHRLADQQVGKHVMDDRGHGARRVVGLAQPDQSLIGVDAQPHGVGVCVEPYSLELFDLHACVTSAGIR
jgi:hypothetical protein